MVKNQRIKRKINNFLFDHRKTKEFLHSTWCIFIAIVSAFIFAFAFSSFITPHDSSDPNVLIVTGGISGLSQNLNKIVEIISGGKKIDPNVLVGIGYTCFNIPLLVFAFFKIGKRFSIYSAVNVVASTLFISFILPNICKDQGGLGEIIGNNPIICNSVTMRVLLGGIFVGIASGLAFKANFSCGGIDIVTYYLSLRKSTSVGKYGVLVNSIIVTTYAVLLIICPEQNIDDELNDWTFGLCSLFLSILYLIIVSIVIDAINLRNKKIQVQIITDNKDLGQILISNFPHGATMTKGQGVYANVERYIFFMIISSNESSEVVKLARRVDPHAFISVTSLKQVYGNFFIKPVE